VALAYTKGARYLLIIVDDKRLKAPPKRRFSATTASRIAPLGELAENATFRRQNRLTGGRLNENELHGLGEDKLG
jgi:hypothetical protein